MHVPMRKAVLRELAVPEVPLATQPADPAIVSEDVGVSDLAGEISGCGLADVALSDPVVDPVLRGDATGQKGRAAGRADWRGDEEIVKAHAGLGDAVDCRGADFRVAITAGGPGALVVAEDEDDVGSIHWPIPELKVGFCWSRGLFNVCLPA